MQEVKKVLEYQQGDAKAVRKMKVCMQNIVMVFLFAFHLKRDTRQAFGTLGIKSKINLPHWVTKFTQGQLKFIE
jgi:predicted component of type VI protein secretion system